MNEIFESTLIKALGHTLFHSLWQFSLIGLLMYVIQLRLPSAKSRYLAGMSAICLMLLSAIGTFCLYAYAGPSDQSSRISPTLEAEGSGTIALIPEGFQAPLPAIIETRWIDEWAVYLVFAWLMGLLLFLFRLGQDFWKLQNLKRWARPLKNSLWESSLQHLKNSLGIRSAVAIMESTWVHSPVVIGWIKPVIYMPIGILNHLSAEEAEAVLAHELAHIARQDWIVNLLQTIIESIFYYHPAVWWLSGRVRQERENCCDDTALQLTKNRLCYAKTLLRIQELATPVSSVGLVLGMDGSATTLHPDKRRMFLLERIRRILNQPQPTSFNMGKFMAMLLLLALLLTGIFRANTAPFITKSIGSAEQNQSPEPSVSEVLPATLNSPEMDSFPKGKKGHSIQRIYREEDDGKKVELEAKNGKVTKLILNDQLIPESEYDQHKSLINSILNTAPPTPPSAPEAPGFMERQQYPAPPPAPETPGFMERQRYPAPPPAPAAPPRPPQRSWPGADDRQGYYWYQGTPLWNDHDKLHIAGDAESGRTIEVYSPEGETTHITIRNGEVFVNGKKVEQGEAYEIQGHILRLGDFQSTAGQWATPRAAAPLMFPYPDEGPIHAYALAPLPEQRMALAELRQSQMSADALERLEEELKMAEESLEKARKESHKSAKALKKSRKSAEKDAKRAAKEEMELAKKMRYDNGVIILRNRKQI